VSGLEYMHTRNIFYSEINLEKILINFNKYQNNVIEGKIPEKIKYSEITLDDSFTLKIADLDYYKNIEMPKEEEATSGTKINLNPNITNSIYIDNSKRNYNDKIDLLSLGCMTYELLTGQAPLSGNSPEDIYNKIKSGQNSFPAKLVASSEIISFINGLLQFNPEKRMNWSQIKSHPFLTKNVDNFNFIELNAIDKNEIEKNPEECDNLLWLFFKPKSSELILDKININSKEAEKDESEININLNENTITESIIINNENTVVNGEEKEKKIEEERKRLHEERDNAEKNIKKANLQMFEVIVYQQQEVKINDELNQ
jgi:serine/threonine protein kinase